MKNPAKPKQPIAIKPSRKGLLHKKLGVPESKPIPSAKLAQAKQSPSPVLRKEATFAQNAKGFAHPGDGYELPKAHTSRHR